MKNALNNQVGMLGDMFLWLVANLKQGVIYFIKQALPPNKSAGSVLMFSKRHFIRGSVMIKHFNFFNLRGPNSFTTGNPSYNPSYNPSTDIRRGQNSGRITVSKNGRDGSITVSQNGRVLSQDEIDYLPEYIKTDILNKLNSGTLDRTNPLSSGTNSPET